VSEPQGPPDEGQEGAFPAAPPGFRSGFVALIGRPNVGKSTLLNRLIGQKVSIVSSVPQTTRNRIQAVLTVPGRAQIVFLDTPGIHKPKFRMNRRMVGLALEAMGGTDLVLFMVDAHEGKGPGDGFVMQRLRDVSAPVFLLLNKIDRIPKQTLLPLIDAYRTEGEFAEVLPISAADGTQCDRLLDLLIEALPEGPAYFPEDYLTDQPERHLAAEIVREKIFWHTRQEVPHSVAVRIDEFHEEEGLVHLGATVLVERESHKGIVIGRGGKLLKQVGTEARKELESILGSKVFLEIWVRVEPDWRQRGPILDELGVTGPEHAPPTPRGPDDKS
jgi:GTP-binding protein Era